MKLVVLFTILGAVPILACRSVALPPGNCQPYLDALAVQDPLADAEKVARSATPYLLAIQGFSLTFPGVDDANAPTRIGYRIMEGTSDEIWDDSCRVYQKKAQIYAERFNRKIMDLTRDPFESLSEER